MSNRSKLHPLLLIQRNLLIAIAYKILNMGPTDISKVFGLSREAVYNILDQKDLKHIEADALLEVGASK